MRNSDCPFARETCNETIFVKAPIWNRGWIGSENLNQNALNPPAGERRNFEAARWYRIRELPVAIGASPDARAARRSTASSGSPTRVGTTPHRGFVPPDGCAGRGEARTMRRNSAKARASVEARGIRKPSSRTLRTAASRRWPGRAIPLGRGPRRRRRNRSARSSRRKPSARRSFRGSSRCPANALEQEHALIPEPEVPGESRPALDPTAHEAAKDQRNWLTALRRPTRRGRRTKGTRSGPARARSSGTRTTGRTASGRAGSRLASARVAL